MPQKHVAGCPAGNCSAASGRMPTPPDSTATPKVGEAVVIKVTNMQIPGVITEASPIPGADGKRRIIITPKVPASQIFAPGLPVQVTIKDQQA